MVATELTELERDMLAALKEADDFVARLIVWGQKYSGGATKDAPPPYALQTRIRDTIAKVEGVNTHRYDDRDE